MVERKAAINAIVRRESLQLPAGDAYGHRLRMADACRLRQARRSTRIDQEESVLAATIHSMRSLDRALGLALDREIERSSSRNRRTDGLFLIYSRDPKPFLEGHPDFRTKPVAQRQPDLMPPLVGMRRRVEQIATQLADVFAAVPESERDVILNDVTGGRITCETLKLWGVKYVFGNTGAYEAGFVDALVDFEDIHYVLGLQEGSVMAMADGYARITGQTSFVNIHSITGTANALGLIVNAWADSSPGRCNGSDPARRCFRRRTRVRA